MSHIANNIIVKKEGNRTIIICYEIKTEILHYGACILKKNKNLVSDLDIKYHTQTAMNRLLKCPVMVGVDKDTFNIKNIRKLLLIHGVKGNRINKPTSSTTTPSPRFLDNYDLIENDAIFKFGKCIKIFNNVDKKTVTKYISKKENITKKEVMLFKNQVQKLSNRYRYITDEREIYILCKFNDKTYMLEYGASIYRKYNKYDKLYDEDINKHYSTALDRLIQCPVKIPFYQFIEQNGTTKINNEDIMFTVKNMIFKKKSGSKKIRIKGEKL